MGKCRKFERNVQFTLLSENISEIIDKELSELLNSLSIINLIGRIVKYIISKIIALL